MDDMPPIVAARVLGHGLLLAPNDVGHNALVQDILACAHEQRVLVALAHLYVHGLICVFYNPKGPTPSVTPRLPLETAVHDPDLQLESSSSNAENLRVLTLLRDNYRCVFTGRVDMDHEDIATDVGPLTKTTPTNVAHIISQSLTEDISGVTPTVLAKFEWARTSGAIIEHFGGFSVHDVLGQDDLHSLKNAFTASLDPHMRLDVLDIWLTPAMDAQRQVIPGTYDVIHFKDCLHTTDINPRVVFRSLSVDDVKIPAPDPRIIALHAACARVAHTSGAMDYLREFYRDTDSIAVMTQPNAAYELSRALKALQFNTSATADS
ncbi:hypothetical protein C8Q76DRAFT_797492 [Earliella scabrosa]|nr:hypothetical protein C8Q76DRAFT_797492 [Earliella scabrosa]